MEHLTIRDVPDDVMRALREEASESARSLDMVVRSVLRRHVERRRAGERGADRARAMDALRERIAERTDGPLEDSVSLIREDRER